MREVIGALILITTIFAKGSDENTVAVFAVGLILWKILNVAEEILKELKEATKDEM